VSNLGTGVHLRAGSRFLVGPGFGCQSNYGGIGPLVQNFEKSLEPEMEVETGKKLEPAPKSTIGLWLESKSEPAPKPGLFQVLVLKILRFQLLIFLKVFLLDMLLV
jgi:hypothetical protein